MLKHIDKKNKQRNKQKEKTSAATTTTKKLCYQSLKSYSRKKEWSQNLDKIFENALRGFISQSSS